MLAFLIFRFFFLCSIISLLNHAIESGTSTVLLAATAGVGVLFAKRYVKTGKVTDTPHPSFIKFTIHHLLIYIVSLVALTTFSNLTLNNSNIFLPLNWSAHLELVLYTFLISSVTTWLTLSTKHWITAEVTALIITAVSIHAAHRNLHLEFPKFIQALSWELGTNVLLTFVVVSAALTTLYFAYFYVAYNVTKRLASNSSSTNTRSITLKARLATLFLPFCMILFGSFLSYQSFYPLTQNGGLLSNGVGQSSGSGSSPLGFHSALGGSNEPAALVRLDGDYKLNPFLPMLYLRESALSQMGENELLVAEFGFDTDVPKSDAASHFSRAEDAKLLDRLKLTQSIYLLAQHKVIFGIDYPVLSTPIKLPNTKRFLSAYKVTSLVPQTKVSELNKLAAVEVGDPEWSNLEWEHYLKTHKDTRYSNLALSLTKEQPTPLDKILAITGYLSRNATYTLSPNHQVAPNTDPVSPFLFGDLRGYCVHFAHASVYLLRSLGIPARIGTGYLTDLSQAKDGHILLRMSDRHAWAEVYIKNYGWVPFDTQPEKVESHADTNVDLNLLEELMNEIGPDEEILPSDIAKDEKNFEAPQAWEKFDVKILYLTLIVIILLFFLTKLYLRYGWWLSTSSQKRLSKAYRSLSFELEDFGYVRNSGETRNEFTRTLKDQQVIKDSALSDLYIPAVYGKELGKTLSDTSLSKALNEERAVLKTLPFYKKIVAFLNPASIFSFFQRLFFVLVFVLPSISVYPNNLSAQKLDLFSGLEEPESLNLEDESKTVEELINEANYLLLDKRPVDARVKLLAVLKKDPAYYKAHAMLAEYYILNVGHYRLALKYVKRAQELFFEKNGQPPYSADLNVRAEHAYLLYLLVQARLNLDNYGGALDALDEYSNFDYFSSWYPGTRAWVLMKLGRIQDAIKVARAGVLAGFDEGRTLNMLGILLSMNGEPENALKIFKQAINYELALGDLGQPATPLNNMGEVYREMFEDDKAESSWRKATRLPDGCEHVLPTLNLSIMLMDQLRHKESDRALDEFLDCIKQFPLRNDEEHRSLVSLMQARSKLFFGAPQEAAQLLVASLEVTQWFGKIGTSGDDLRSAAYLTLSQAYQAQSHQLNTMLSTSILDWFKNMKLNAALKVKSWWALRKARQILTEELKDFEDLEARHTDSLLEYGALSDLMSAIPKSLLLKKISELQKTDLRINALNYYHIYLAKSYLSGSWLNPFNAGNRAKAEKLIDETIPKLRVRYDDKLLLMALLMKLELHDPSSSEYQAAALRVYGMSKAALWNYGGRLPVKFGVSKGEGGGGAEGGAVVDALRGTGSFVEVVEGDNEHRILSSFKDGQYLLEFYGEGSSRVLAKEAGVDLKEVINKFVGAVFRG